MVLCFAELFLWYRTFGIAARQTIWWCQVRRKSTLAKCAAVEESLTSLLSGSSSTWLEGLYGEIAVVRLGFDAWMWANISTESKCEVISECPVTWCADIMWSVHLSLFTVRPCHITSTRIATTTQTPLNDIRHHYEGQLTLTPNSELARS